MDSKLKLKEVLKISSQSVWMVRAGNDNELIDIFEERSLVAIGWEKIGDLSKLPTRKATKEKYEEVYDHKKRRKTLMPGSFIASLMRLKKVT